MEKSGDPFSPLFFNLSPPRTRPRNHFVKGRPHKAADPSLLSLLRRYDQNPGSSRHATGLPLSAFPSSLRPEHVSVRRITTRTVLRQIYISRPASRNRFETAFPRPLPPPFFQLSPSTPPFFSLLSRLRLLPMSYTSFFYYKFPLFTSFPAPHHAIALTVTLSSALGRFPNFFAILSRFLACYFY